uniref:Uncharacterized protein n=1 Tax=Pavo cristatus TaxID=9049 RepID=A0A8C9FSP8_PAVCR
MRSHRLAFMRLQEGSCHLNCHVPLSPFNQVIPFYLHSIKEMLMTQADRFSQEEINQMFAAFPPDVSGNLDYKNLCYVITHGEEKD